MMKYAIHSCDHCQKAEIVPEMGLPDGWVVVSSRATIGNMCSWECASGFAAAQQDSPTPPHAHR